MVQNYPLFKTRVTVHDDYRCLPSECPDECPDVEMLGWLKAEAAQACR
jgi:hypothetical protein